MTHGKSKPWVCYSNGCREQSCREAWRAYQRNQSRQKRRPDGIPTTQYIDASETRDHLRFLSSRGVGVTQISRITGIPRSTVQVVRSGRTKRVSLKVANKLLGVHLGRVTTANKQASRWKNAGAWTRESKSV